MRGDGSLVPFAAAGGGGGAAAVFLPLGIRPPRACCSRSCRLLGWFALLDISSCMHTARRNEDQLLGMRYVSGSESSEELALAPGIFFEHTRSSERVSPRTRRERDW